MIRKSKFSLSKIEKILIQKGYGVYKKRKNISSNNSLKNFFLVAFISIILISTFAILPKVNHIANKVLKKKGIFENYSKSNFERVLNGKKSNADNQNYHFDGYYLTAMLPLEIVDGFVRVAASFRGRVGFTQQF